MRLTLFTKSSIVFLGIAAVLLAAYFILGAGAVNLSAKDAARNRWRAALRRVTQFAVFLAVVAIGGLMPKPAERMAERIFNGCLSWLEPVGSKIPGVKDLF